MCIRDSAAATRAKTWERRARNAEAVNQELEWRLRVATANGGKMTSRSTSPAPDPPTTRETSTPSRARTKSSAATKDVIIEGLRLETEALKSALAAARAETRAVAAFNVADDDE